MELDGEKSYKSTLRVLKDISNAAGYLSRSIINGKDMLEDEKVNEQYIKDGILDLYKLVGMIQPCYTKETEEIRRAEIEELKKSNPDYMRKFYKDMEEINDLINELFFDRHNKKKDSKGESK